MSDQVQETWPIPKTIVDGITERLRRAIITGTIRPGERIRVADLERKFGVSHIPIREALRRLQSEGFVEISPRRTTIAAGVDLSDLANIYDLRRIIELEIGRRSVSRMTKKDVDSVYNRPPFPATWARMHGKGRVFYTSMGHREDIWANPMFQSLLTGGVNWALGNAEADVTPNVEKATPGFRTIPPEK